MIYRSYEDGSFESVAMSLPGKVDSEKGVVYFGGSLPYLHNFDFNKHFKETYGKRCTIINDGKAAALCELWLGNLQGVRNGLVITLGVAALFHDYVKELQKLIINLQAVLNMEKVLIGGGISEQPLLLDELNAQYDKLRQLSPIYGNVFEPLVIDTCAFKNNSNILGAVYASMHIDQS